jgi:hypothetical protein
VRSPERKFEALWPGRILVKEISQIAGRAVRRADSQEHEPS